jgi:hypothetical protein
MLLAALDCRQPTEVVVEIDTDGPCDALQGVTIVGATREDVETATAQTHTTACAAGGRIGTLVLVPIADDGASFAVRIVAGVGQPVDACQPPSYGPKCIVARRALRYIPHTPLTLPIMLRQSCEGVPCKPDETCVDGKCLSAAVPDPLACAGSDGCGENELQQVDGGPSVPPDGAPPDGAGDATLDATADGPKPPSDAASDGAADVVAFEAGTIGPANPVASGYTNLGSIAIDATNVYFADAPQIWALGSSTACPSKAARPFRSSLLDTPHAMSIDGTYVYFGTNDGRVDRVPILGGPLTEMFNLAGKAAATTVDASNVYWTDFLDQSVWKQALGGAQNSGAKLASNLTTLGDIAVDGTNVYYLNQATVWSIPKAGGTGKLVASANNPVRVATDGTYVYYADNFSYGIYKVPVGGGVVTTHASTTQTGAPSDIAIDGTFVYWTARIDGTVNRVPVGGGNAESIASGQTLASEIAVGPTALAWLSVGDGAVVVALRH